MKLKYLITLAVAFITCSLFGQTFITNGAPAAEPPVPVPTGTGWLLAVIPLLVPILVATAKWIIPAIPKVALPIIAPILGALIDYIGSLALGANASPVLAVALGSAGVGLREILDQVLKSRDSTKRVVPIIAALSILGTTTACRSLAPGGAYQSDEVTYNAELAIVTSKDVITTFVKWEKDNREALRKFPEIKQAADSMRANAKQWFASAYATYDAYKIDPASENQAALERSISVLRAALNEASKYMVKASTGK